MDQAEYIKAKCDVLKRMEAAGWVTELKRSGDDATCVPTKEGRVIMRSIERLFFFDGKTINTQEMVAFCAIIKGFEYALKRAE